MGSGDKRSVWNRGIEMLEELKKTAYDAMSDGIRDKNYYRKYGKDAYYGQ